MALDWTTASIDRSSPVPFYFQLKQLIAEEISGGRWAPGERIPTEFELCARFDVSRSTVRQALAELESEGMLRKEKGRGTFVAEVRPGSRFLQSSHGFYDEAARAGKTVISRVLRREVGVLPDWAAEALGLPAGSQGVALERLRSVDGEPVMYVASYLIGELASSILSADLTAASLYGTLREREGLTVAGGRRVVEAVTAGGELAHLLGVEEGAPLLFVQAVSWDTGRRPFECYRAWHRSDRTKIEVQVVPEEAAATVGLDPTTMRIGDR
jgi:GntR family transcriptional regulator